MADMQQAIQYFNEHYITSSLEFSKLRKRLQHNIDTFEMEIDDFAGKLERDKGIIFAELFKNKAVIVTE